MGKERSGPRAGDLRDLDRSIDGLVSLSGMLQRRRKELEAERSRYSPAEYERALEGLVAEGRRSAESITRTAVSAAQRIQVGLQAAEIVNTLRPVEATHRATEIAGAWSGRVQPMLDQGIAVDVALAHFRELGDEYAVRALAANAPSYVAAKGGPTAMDSQETRGLVAQARRATALAVEDFEPKDLREERAASRELEAMTEKINAHQRLVMRQAERPGRHG